MPSNTGRSERDEVFVEATPISARRGIDDTSLPAPSSCDDMVMERPRLRSRASRMGASVSGGLTGLRDANHQRFLVDDRLPVAELRAGSDFNRDAREVLDDVLAEKGGRSTTCPPPPS